MTAAGAPGWVGGGDDALGSFIMAAFQRLSRTRRGSTRWTSRLRPSSGVVRSARPARAVMWHPLQGCSSSDYAMPRQLLGMRANQMLRQVRPHIPATIAYLALELDKRDAAPLSTITL